MRRAVDDMLSHISVLDERIDEYDAHIKQAATADVPSQRLMKLDGIGPITASALTASIGNGHDFKNGRQLAAWLDLVPGRVGSGGKTRLGRITMAGDRYLRTLLVMGARSLLSLAANKSDRLSLRGKPVSRKNPRGASCFPTKKRKGTFFGSAVHDEVTV